jgi:hypothetical protein
MTHDPEQTARGVPPSRGRMSPNVPAERISTGFERPGVSDSDADLLPAGRRAVKPSPGL